MKKQLLITVLGIICLSLLTNYSFAQLSLQLTPSDFNGYAVSCFGGNTGTVDLTVTGGTAPFTYEWSNASTTEDISGLRSGYYHVLVTDANAATAEAEITLTEPLEFRVRLEASEYNLNGNIFNVSCAICSDGSITTIPENGIAPLVYLWENNSTNQNRSGLPEGSYKLTIIDNNSCKANAEVFLDAPERTD